MHSHKHLYTFIYISLFPLNLSLSLCLYKKMHSNILITLSIIAISFQQLAEGKPIPVSRPPHEIIKRNICSQVEIDAGTCVVADTQTYDAGVAPSAAGYPNYQSTANNAATGYSTTSYPATSYSEPASTSKGKGSLIKIPTLPSLDLPGLPGLPGLPALQPPPQPAPAPAYYPPYPYYPPSPPPPSPPASKEDDEAGDDDDDDDSKEDEA